MRPADAGRGQKPNHRTTEPLGGALTEKVRTAVVPPWDDRGNIALATEESLENLALYAGNLGEAHCFEEIFAAAPHLPGDWTIRFAARGAKLAALKAAASGMRHTAESIRSEAEGPVEYAGPVKLSSDSAASRAEHSTGQGGLTLTDLKLKSAGAGVRGQAERRQGTGDRRQGAAVEITGYASEEETPGLLASARVHLITMSPGWEGIVVPSKLYGCIRTGRPVLFIGPENADTAREICAHDWGKVLPPGASGEEVAGAILRTCGAADEGGAVGERSTGNCKAFGNIGHSRPQGTEDSPQANRQLEELSEAVKLARMKGRISPCGYADRTWRQMLMPGDCLRATCGSGRSRLVRQAENPVCGCAAAR